MQPYDEGLYAYPGSYNQWAPKVHSPLTTKNFPWGLGTMNHLSPTGIVSSQPMCFSSPSNSMTSSMSGYGSMGAINNVSGSAGPGCPYGGGATPASYYYNREQCSAGGLASLRLRAAKAAHPAMTPYGSPPPSSSSGGHLSPSCQYTPVSSPMP